MRRFIGVAVAAVALVLGPAVPADAATVRTTANIANLTPNAGISVGPDHLLARINETRLSLYCSKWTLTELTGDKLVGKKCGFPCACLPYVVVDRGTRKYAGCHGSGVFRYTSLGERMNLTLTGAICRP